MARHASAAGQWGRLDLDRDSMMYRRGRSFRSGWAYSSAGEHFVDIEGVTGSIPVTPTIFFKDLASIPNRLKSPTVTKRTQAHGVIRGAVALFIDVLL